MPLLDRIKAGREQKPGQQIWPVTAFAAVAAIVQMYGLTGLADLESERPRRETLTPSERRSLFPLLSAAQYQLTMAILQEYDNPYLGYARTPGEIAISHQLWQGHAELDPMSLARTSLTAIWRRQSAGWPK